MDYQELQPTGGNTVLRGLRHFMLAEILDCGQCFRWRPAGEHSWQGTVAGRVRTVTQRGDELTFHNVPPEEFHALWRGYFDLDRDYGAVKEALCTDAVLRDAVAFTPGMRVLRQPPWETLCSFIISANNNIPRIRGIVERLCGLFGELVEGGHDFPTPERLATLTADDLAPVRCGYRAAYLIDAARLVASGELDLAPIYTMPLPEAREQLRRVKGVGPKVAECALLYGFARAECVPVDVWIKRVLNTLYPNGLPPQTQPVAGLGQQYLFHYVRNHPEILQIPVRDAG